MAKSYIDQVLERAEKATVGPWKHEPSNHGYRLLYQPFLRYGKYWEGNENDWEIINGLPDNVNKIETYHHNDAEFIAHARTDVPELARRLKKACDLLREAEGRPHGHTEKTFSDLADELEG